MQVSQIIINFGNDIRPFKLIELLELTPQNPLTKFQIDNHFQILVNSTTKNTTYFSETSRRDIYFINATNVDSYINDLLNKTTINDYDLNLILDAVESFIYSTQKLTIEGNWIEIKYDKKLELHAK